jgi:glycosyltransferase involved in cell wall biosynthesis
MPKVLHIGPCDTPGGMANVMRTLAEYPPEGWEADLLSSHVVGSPWAKWRAYRRARSALSKMLSDENRRPDIVHLHTAADWSWWRKTKFLKLTHKKNVGCVIHIHSGRFDSWLENKSRIFKQNVRLILSGNNTKVVVLSKTWTKLLEKDLGDLIAISNPLNPKYNQIERKNTQNHLLLLGRKDPVKGHSFAVTVALELKKTFPDLVMTMTGVEESDKDWIKARGWVTEKEKLELLSAASVLLLPSKFEGQPMVAIEALASGLPVVADSRLHSLPMEVIHAGPSIESWCEVVTKALEHPQSVDFNCSSFDVRAIGKKWKSVYDSLINP